MAINFYLIIKHFRVERLSAVIFSAVCGILTADFGSGIVHWCADTWGSIELPIIGKNFLRPFREHHIDPTSITRHDWIETNGDNFMVALPILGKLTWIFFSCSRAEIQVEYPFCAYLFLCSIFVAITNQARHRNEVDFAVALTEFFFLFTSLDSQVVAHIFRCASVGAGFAESPHHLASKASSHPPRVAARNLFLHHNRLAQLATRKNQVRSIN